MNRHCKICHIEKPIEEYGEYKSGGNTYIRLYCKSCGKIKYSIPRRKQRKHNIIKMANGVEVMDNLFGRHISTNN